MTGEGDSSKKKGAEESMFSTPVEYEQHTYKNDNP